MLSNECDEPPSALCYLSVCTVVKLCAFGVSFTGELGFMDMNCDDICMCAVNKQFEFLEFVFDSRVRG